jgi:anti-sigma factor RsiW
MNWTCEQTELRLSDYLDGLLNQADQSAFDAHVNGCERCTPLVSGVSHLLTNLHGMEELETPPRLVYSILDKTLGPRDSVSGWRAVLAWVRLIASPRFAYGAVSVTATLMVLLTASGFSWRKPKMADLSPVNVYRNADRQVHLVFARGSKFVSDLRVVYEIQSRLHQENEIPTTPEGTLPQSPADKLPGRTDGTWPSSPRQQNRANGMGHELEVLAAELPILAPRKMQ